MNDDKHEEVMDALQALADGMNKLGQVHVRTLRTLAYLEAKQRAQSDLLMTLLVNDGGNVQQLLQQFHTQLERYHKETQNELSEWLVEKEISYPKPDDPWWDKPSSE